MRNQPADIRQEQQSTQRDEQTSAQRSMMWLLAAAALIALIAVFALGIWGLTPSPPDKDLSCTQCAAASSQPAASQAASAQSKADQPQSARWTQESGGQLGDFVGGITNPILAFLTLSALIYTINLQREELKLSRVELRLSKDALRDAANAQLASAQAQKISNDLTKAIASIDSLKVLVAQNTRLLDEAQLNLQVTEQLQPISNSVLHAKEVTTIKAAIAQLRSTVERLTSDLEAATIKLQELNTGSGSPAISALGDNS